MNLSHTARPQRRKCADAKKKNDALLGILRTWGNDTEAALHELRGCLASHPDSCRVHSYLGIVLRKREQWEESLAAFREAEARAEAPFSKALVQIQIADVLQEKGDLKAAVAKYQEIIKEGSRGKKSLSDAEFADALTYRHLPGEGAFVSLAYLRMGDALLALNRRSEARAAWKNALRHDFSNSVGKETRQKLKENP